MKPQLENPAILIIDVQRGFLEEGFPLYRPVDANLIPRIRRLIELGRKMKVPIIYILQVLRPDGIDAGLQVKKFPEILGKFTENSKDIEIVDDIKPKEGDIIVKKRKYSAFFGTELDTILRNLKVRSLVVVGGALNYCVRSTVHDAFFRDYTVIALQDCIYPSVRDPDLNMFYAELKAIQAGYGDVMTLEDFLKLYGWS